ncbi:TetR/AcrR family transcriptional regulator [Pusillimonas sp. NJUB218]|uniref:TetR/AcrR family transcriptional regulator n=1 Tax=Pusillimonas sp. NJUB218 TaxID=2023230 RepID=UPI000F4BB43A|nr:TetR/AcrR family transcriptional regulator [Pusillimonas sp. NJUB218]ROT46437.1 hypothetical protein CHR62_00395 [Pusillimonas sp. NJUB218]
MARSVNSPQKTVRRELLQDSIMEAASRLFIQRGFQGTSMGDIAEAMGVTRTAIYYYFRNKEAILRELTSGITEMAAKLAVGVTTEHADPEETLRKLVAQHASLILANPLQFRVVERNEEQLSPSIKKKAEASRRMVLERFSAAIDAGIRTGQFRNVNAKVAAFAIIGMCNWGAWWFNPKGALGFDDVVKTIVDLAMNSVLRVEERQLRDGSIGEVVRQLRDDLSVLERRISELPGS